MLHIIFLFSAKLIVQLSALSVVKRYVYMYSVLHVAQMYSYSETHAKLIETFSLHHVQMQLRDRSFNYLIAYGPTIKDAAFLHIQYYVVAFQKVVTHRQCWASYFVKVTSYILHITYN